MKHTFLSHDPRDPETAVLALAAAPLRVGGMAFGNGVLMRGPHYWAWARADGSLVDARVHTLLDRHRLLRSPVVRSAVSLAEMVALMVRLHSRNGLRRGLIFLAWLAVAVIVDFWLSMVVPAFIHGYFLAQVVLAFLTFAVSLLALRQGLGAKVWKYHGAEHKAVNAYEHGADLTDVRQVMTYSRIHNRCGTNLVVICFVLLLLGYLPLASPVMGGMLGTIYSLFVAVLALEVFRLVTRRPQARLSRVVLAGGRGLQRCFTTREPAPEQLELACKALRRVLELERGA